MEDNVFKLANSFDVKAYLQHRYNLTFKNNVTLCPFHDDTSPSFSVYKNYLKCFAGCPWNNGKDTGSLVDFVSNYEKITPLDAAKNICDNSNIVYNSKSKQQIKTKDNKNLLLKAKAESCVSGAQTHHELFNRALAEIIVYPDMLPQKWKEHYLGWDNSEKSITIISHSLVSGQVWNIKHKHKKSFDGKWISFPKSQVFPFPFDYFKENDDNRMIVCEGEKDVMNLVCLGVNCLTLGGVQNSWSKFSHLLSNKEIYIWFDHDEAGYNNALKRFDELKDDAKEVHIVLFNTMDETLPEHYDISDYLGNTELKNNEDLFNNIKVHAVPTKEEAIQAIRSKRDLQVKNTVEAKTDPNIVTDNHDVLKHNTVFPFISVFIFIINYITKSPNIEHSLKIKDYWKQTSILLSIAFLLLVISLCFHKSLPYEFYTFKRVINFSSFILVAFLSYKQKYFNFAMIFGILAFLFNPLHPFWLTRTLWVVVDWIVLMMIAVYLVFKNRLFHRLTDVLRK